MCKQQESIRICKEILSIIVWKNVDVRHCVCDLYLRMRSDLATELEYLRKMFVSVIEEELKITIIILNSIRGYSYRIHSTYVHDVVLVA